jgi:hypothetical protein
VTEGMLRLAVARAFFGNFFVTNSTIGANIMKFHKICALGAVLASSLFATQQASAASVLLSTFKTGGPIVSGIFTFTYIDSTFTPDPGAPGGFPAIDDTNLPDDIILSISNPIPGVANFNITNADILTPLGPELFNLSYTVELYADDPTNDPERRFQTIGLGANIDSNFTNASAQKWIFGQDTVVVSPATFSASLDVDFASNAATATCGICRKFVITDILDTRDGGGAEGILNSVSNSYNTIAQSVPVPAPIALFGAGLLGLAGMLRRRSRG